MTPELYFLSFLSCCLAFFGTEYFLMRKELKSMIDEFDYWKEKYEQLHFDQIQELLDDRDFGNND